MNIKPQRPTDILVGQFLERARELNANIELIKVLKARTYRIADSNVLIRAASDGNRRYFFGINYIHVEELANLDNPFIAFICGALDKTIILPAQVLFSNLHQISHDRNGEYKVNIDHDLNLILKGRNNRYNCKEFVDAWNLLLTPNNLPKGNIGVEESLHSVIQGRILEIGRIRGFQTYCPDKSKTFNKKKLKEISTLDICPQLQFSDYDILRRIDVLWFREKGIKLIPDKAFEVEISTGTWSGVGRMATLIDYKDVGLYVISNDPKKYNQVMNAFYNIHSQYKHIKIDAVSELYSAELQLRELRNNIGL